MFGTKIKIESTMLNCTQILEIDKNLLSQLSGAHLSASKKRQLSGAQLTASEKRTIGPRTVGPRVSYQVRLLSLGPIGPWEGRTQFLKGVYNSPFLILSWFFCQTFGWVIKLDCCLLGGRAQFLKGVYNSTFLILSWFFCQTFGWVIKFDCCLWALSGPERGEHNF